MNEVVRKPHVILGLFGAVVGAALGVLAFQWFLRQGFYGLILPPALMGLGAGIAARGRSIVLAATCGVLGFCLALGVEWQFFPFKDDHSLFYFLTHLSSLRPVTWVMIVVGTVASYRLALGLDTSSHKS